EVRDAKQQWRHLPCRYSQVASKNIFTQRAATLMDFRAQVPIAHHHTYQKLTFFQGSSNGTV
ncbi:MAG: hypothetical protein AAF290_12280, partial [Pseudomonadota bacterium]